MGGWEYQGVVGGVRGGGEVPLPVAGEGGGVEVQAAVGVVYIDRAARTTSSDTAIIRDYRGERKG